MQAGNNRGDHGRVNLAEIHFCAQGQRVKAKVVDGAGSALAGFGDELDCARGEQVLAKRARHFESVVDVANGLFGGERFNVADSGDALAKLDERRVEQFFRELRLAGEDDLDQLAARGFKVGEEANALEDGFREVLRLVNDDDEFAAGAIFLDDLVAELVVHLGAAARGSDAEVAENMGDKFARLALGIDIEEEDDAGGVADVFEKAEEEGRFACSGGRNHGGETTIAGEAEFEGFERLPMGAAEIEAAWIGVNSEWIYFKTEVLQQHDGNLQPATVRLTPAGARSREARAAPRAMNPCYLESPNY